MAKEKTYAEEAKAIMNKYKLRLGDNFDKGDTLSLEAMNQELTALREAQEVTREAEMDQSEFQLANGGGIARSEYYQGDFGADAGPFSTPDDAPGEAFHSRVPWMGAASGIIGSLIGNKPIDLPEYNYEEFKPQTVAPQTVSYARGREQIQRERDIASARTAKAARGFGSQSALMEATLAGTTEAQSVAGQQFEQSLEQEANINAQIRNQMSQFNAAQQAQAAQINMRQQMYGHDVERGNVLMNQRRKDARLQGIIESATGYTKDLIAADQYDQMLQIMAPENYSFTAGDDSRARRWLGISPKMKRTFTGTNDLIG
jgi:hypothetical protein